MPNIINSKKYYLADISLLIIQAIWGSTFFIVKGVQTSLPPLVLLSYRFLVPAIILGTFLKIKNKNLFENLKPGLIVGFVLWLVYFTQTIGLNITSAANSAFITGLFVVFIPIIAIFFRQKSFSTKKYVALIFSLIGLWILTGGVNGINNGDLITLITAFTVGLHVLLTDRYIKKGINPYIFTFQQLFFIGTLSLILSIIFKLPLEIINSKILFQLLYLGIFASLLCYVVQSVAQKYTSPLKVGFIFSMETVFASVFTWTLGGEQFIPLRALGGLLIFAAILISEIPIEKFWSK